MNKPRYSDHNGGNNSWHSNSNSRQSAQSTGRSNYGGSRRNNRQGNPIGNWINRRRQRRLEHQQSSSDSDRVAVGTERNAQLNMTKNAKHFSYPAEGFITPIGKYTPFLLCIWCVPILVCCVLYSFVWYNDYEICIWLGERYEYSL